MTQNPPSPDAVTHAVLAFSGGLDTTIIVPWLKEQYGCRVTAYVADVGQGADELDGLEERALAIGADRFIQEDLREEFCRDYLFPMVQSGAVYEGRYLLGTSIARPLIAKRIIAAAEDVGADAVAHGCTGKGNDQARFELGFKAFNPTIKVIAPWRQWNIRSREEAVQYAAKRNLELTVDPHKIYSHDRNLWHISSEGGELEDPWQDPPDRIYHLTRSPQEAPAEGCDVTLGFERGFPVSLDGRELGGAEMMEALNQLGCTHGIGRVDIVENRLVGMKSRGVYETPGGTILYAAHHELESLVLDGETLHFKEQLAPKYAELLYNGRYFVPLRDALDAFIRETQHNVTGEVRLHLYKGNVIVKGRRSPYSLYREDLATFGADDVYDQSDAEGFINLYGLPIKVRTLIEMEGGKRLDGYQAPRYSRFYNTFKRD